MPVIVSNSRLYRWGNYREGDSAALKAGVYSERIMAPLAQSIFEMLLNVASVSQRTAISFRRASACLGRGRILAFGARTPWRSVSTSSPKTRPAGRIVLSIAQPSSTPFPSVVIL